MNARSFTTTLMLALALGSCAVELEPNEPIGDATEELFGSFSTTSCTAEETATLTESMRVGRIVASGSAFEACMRSRITEHYLPCDGEAYADRDRPTQLERALHITRVWNRADVDVTCEALSANGHALIGDYGDDDEEVSIDEGLLARNRANGLDAFERAEIAATIWHEAMHQQGYDHADDDADPADCGYDAGEYARGSNSIPYIVGGCIQSAAIEGRAVGWTASGAGASLAFGTHLASRGDLGVLDRALTILRLPPASRARYCITESASVCAPWFSNDDVGYGRRIDVPAASASGIVRVDVEPRVLLFTETEQRGTVQSIGPGELLANRGDLATVGNDRARSLYVPPGLRLRACSDEGATGHGVGTCAFFDAPAATLGTLDGRISYVEVVPVVTAFIEGDLFGLRQGFGPGVYVGREGGFGALGDDTIRSLVVPPGMSVQACTDATSAGVPAGSCTTFTRSAATVPASISYLAITPAPALTERLAVTRSGGGTGSVVSMPTGIVCGSRCSASYAARSEVRLRASPGPQTRLTWSGCDRIEGNDCFVTMHSARTVTANLRDTVLDFACYDACLDGCVPGSPRATTCDATCDAACRR